MIEMIERKDIAKILHEMIERKDVDSYFAVVLWLFYGGLLVLL